MRDEAKMDANRLIAEVHRRPALWNQRHMSYHNREITNRVWMEIAAMFKLPSEYFCFHLHEVYTVCGEGMIIYAYAPATRQRCPGVEFSSLQERAASRTRCVCFSRNLTCKLQQRRFAREPSSLGERDSKSAMRVSFCCDFPVLESSACFDCSFEPSDAIFFFYN